MAHWPFRGDPGIAEQPSTAGVVVSSRQAFGLVGVGPEALKEHFLSPTPTPAHAGLDASSILVSVPLEPVRLMLSAESCCCSVPGGQSRLVVPNEGIGELPLASHGMPCRGPPSH